MTATTRSQTRPLMMSRTASAKDASCVNSVAPDEKPNCHSNGTPSDRAAAPGPDQPSKVAEIDSMLSALIAAATPRPTRTARVMPDSDVAVAISPPETTTFLWLCRTSDASAARLSSPLCANLNASVLTR